MFVLFFLQKVTSRVNINYLSNNGFCTTNHHWVYNWFMPVSHGTLEMCCYCTQKFTIKVAKVQLNFLHNTHNTLPIACPWAVGCLLCLQSQLYVLYQSLQYSMEYNVVLDHLIITENQELSWKPTLSLLVALQVGIMTTCSATSNDKVGIMITLSFHWIGPYCICNHSDENI